MLKSVMPEDFIKYGMIPEFIGRVPVVVSLDSLDEEALVRILTEPKNSLVKQYCKLFELDSVQLTMTEDALRAIAKKSIERKTGARGLRAIVESTLMDLMFRVPSDDTIGECIITKEVVEGAADPQIIYRDQPVPQKKPVPNRRKGGPATA